MPNKRLEIGRISPDRPITSYAKVQALIASLIRTKSFHINKARQEKKEYLDIGCGPNTHDRFINLDYGWRPDIDICWDVTKGIPLADASVKGIFTEHCLEHLPMPKVDFVLNDIYRVLKPQGTVRIVVPDGELYLSRYTRLMERETADPLPYSASDPYQGLYTPIMSVNRIFRAHGHQFIFDYQTFELLLRKNGFSDVRRESFMSGRDELLLIDTEARAIESLYIEATKK